MMGTPLPINQWFQWCIFKAQNRWLHFQWIRMIILPSFTTKRVIHHSLMNHLIVPASNVEKWPFHILVQHPRRELPHWYLRSTSSLCWSDWSTECAVWNSVNSQKKIRRSSISDTDGYYCQSIPINYFVSTLTCDSVQKSVDGTWIEEWWLRNSEVITKCANEIVGWIPTARRLHKNTQCKGVFNDDLAKREARTLSQMPNHEILWIFWLLKLSDRYFQLPLHFKYHGMKFLSILECPAKHGKRTTPGCTDKWLTSSPLVALVASFPIVRNCELRPNKSLASTESYSVWNWNKGPIDSYLEVLLPLVDLFRKIFLVDLDMGWYDRVFLETFPKSE